MPVVMTEILAVVAVQTAFEIVCFVFSALLLLTDPSKQDNLCSLQDAYSFPPLRISRISGVAM